jgi:hypothetical protein
MLYAVIEFNSGKIGEITTFGDIDEAEVHAAAFATKTESITPLGFFKKAINEIRENKEWTDSTGTVKVFVREIDPPNKY